MTNEDLIKKLEETSFPEIEISSHKRRLRTTLLNKYFQEKRIWEVFSILKKAIPVAVTLTILAVLIYNYLILPEYNLAQAREIVLKDPRIKEWLEEGATIKDVKILEKKAYVLVQPASIKETTIISEPQTPKIKEEFFGALVEVDFKDKKIAKIEKITPEIFPITEKEKEKVTEIFKNSPDIKEAIPEETKIVKIIPTPPPRLSIIKKGDSVEVVPEPNGENKVWVIYEQNKKQWESKVDLDNGKIESTNLVGEPGE